MKNDGRNCRFNVSVVVSAFESIWFAVFFRNFHQNGEGKVQEIGFEEFVVVMSHFRPPSAHMTEEQRGKTRREKLRCMSQYRSHELDCLTFTWRWHKVRPAFVCFSAVLFNMHDTDNDGTITLEEYRHVSSGEEMIVHSHLKFMIILNWVFKLFKNTDCKSKLSLCFICNSSAGVISSISSNATDWLPVTDRMMRLQHYRISYFSCCSRLFRWWRSCYLGVGHWRRKQPNALLMQPCWRWPVFQWVTWYVR